jgi:uncharacterized membrane protein YidH (DUF202 family)
MPTNGRFLPGSVPLSASRQQDWRYPKSCPPFDSRVGASVGLPLIALGIWSAAAAYRQWATNEHAIRDGRPLPRAHLVATVTAGIVLVTTLALTWRRSRLRRNESRMTVRQAPADGTSADALGTAERVELAWQRTGLPLAAIGLAVVRRTLPAVPVRPAMGVPWSDLSHAHSRHGDGPSTAGVGGDDFRGRHDIHRPDDRLHRRAEDPGRARAHEYWAAVGDQRLPSGSGRPIRLRWTLGGYSWHAPRGGDRRGRLRRRLGHVRPDPDRERSRGVDHHVPRLAGRRGRPDVPGGSGHRRR